MSTTTMDRVRRAMPRQVRAAARRVVDPPLRPLSSVRGAESTETFGLTFDDGPDPVSTPAVLDALAAHDAHATFFVLVDRAEQHPEVVRDIVARGHEVGLHGLDHRRPAALTSGALQSWVHDGRDRLQRISPRDIRWFRPPFGSQSVRSFRAVRACGLDVVVWSADVEDWHETEPESIARLADARVRPGGILLMHDAYATAPDAPAEAGPDLDRAAAVDAVLTRLATRNLRAVTVGQLVGEHRPRRTAWFRS